MEDIFLLSFIFTYFSGICLLKTCFSWHPKQMKKHIRNLHFSSVFQTYEKRMSQFFPV